MNESNHFRTGDGCRIAYRLDGNPDLPVLILSNSIATNLSMWDGEVAQLSQNFRVLRYDTRGHGGSDAPDGPYSLDRLGRDVIEMMDALQVERAHFCGLSLGGFVGQWLGIHAPDRIDRLILSNTAPYLGPAPQWDALIDQLQGGRSMDEMADFFIGNWFPPRMIGEQPETVARFHAMVRATSPQGLAGCFAVVRDADLRRTNRLIEAPTLVIGGHDDMVTLASHSEMIAAAIPSARLCLLPGVHMLNVEQPAAFMDAVQAFLAAGSARPA